MSGHDDEAVRVAANLLVLGNRQRDRVGAAGVATLAGEVDHPTPFHVAEDRRLVRRELLDPLVDLAEQALVLRCLHLPRVAIARRAHRVLPPIDVVTGEETSRAPQDAGVWATRPELKETPSV